MTAYDDLVVAQIDVQPVVSERTGSDSTSVLLNVGTFSDGFTFEVPEGVTTDATFDVAVRGLAGVLPNATAVLEVQTSTGWVTLGTAAQGGLLDLLTVAGRGFSVTAEDLQAGTYRLTYGGGGTLGVGTVVTLDAQMTDTSLTDFEVVSAPPVTGSVFDASPAGAADELGAGGTPTLQVLGDGGAYVAVTAATQVEGQFGTLLIGPDGSFTYTPDENAAAIGQVDSFSYQLIGPDGPSPATLYVRLDSPDATVIWDDGDFSAPGTTVVAVGDVAEAGIVLGPLVGDPVVENNAIAIRTLLSLGTVTDTYEFGVAANATSDIALNITSGSAVNLLGATTVTLQRLQGGSWVTVSGGVGGSAVQLLGLTGGGVRAVIDDLATGTYRLRVGVGGLGVATNVTGTATSVTTYLNQEEATGVVSASGNVLSGDDGAGADVLGSDVTALRVEQTDGVFVSPGYGGQLVTGEHGTLRIQANGDYTYTPFEDEAGIGTVDRFTYQLVHPNGQTSTAELAITIGEAPVGAAMTAQIAADGPPDEAALVELHADVAVLDGLSSVALSTEADHAARLSPDDPGTTPDVALAGDDVLPPEFDGDTVVLVGLEDLAPSGDGDGDGSPGPDGDAVPLPALEDVLEIEAQDALADAPVAGPEAEQPHSGSVEPVTVVEIELEPAVLIENPLHDPWANAAHHV